LSLRLGHNRISHEGSQADSPSTSGASCCHKTFMTLPRAANEELCRAIKSLQRGHSARQDIKLVLPGEIECSPKLGELSGNFLIKFVQANRVFMDQTWPVASIKNEK